LFSPRAASFDVFFQSKTGRDRGRFSLVAQRLPAPAALGVTLALARLADLLPPTASVRGHADVSLPVLEQARGDLAAVRDELVAELFCASPTQGFPPPPCRSSYRGALRARRRRKSAERKHKAGGEYGLDDPNFHRKRISRSFVFHPTVKNRRRRRLTDSATRPRDFRYDENRITQTILAAGLVLCVRRSATPRARSAPTI